MKRKNSFFFVGIHERRHTLGGESGGQKYVTILRQKQRGNVIGCCLMCDFVYEALL